MSKYVEKNRYLKILLAIIAFSSSIVNCQPLLASTDSTNISNSNSSNFSNSLRSATTLNEELIKEIPNEPNFEGQISQFLPYPTPEELFQIFQQIDREFRLLKQENQELERELEILRAIINENNSLQESLLTKNRNLEQQLEALQTNLQTNISESSQFEQSLLEENRNLEEKLKIIIQKNIDENNSFKQSLLEENQAVLEKNQNLKQELEKLQVNINKLSKEKRNNNIWLVALASTIGAIISLIGFAGINELYRNQTNKKKSRDIKALEPQVNSIQTNRDYLKIKTEYDQKLNELQDKLKSLEKSLKIEDNSTTPGAIKITGALELPKIIKIDLPKTKLVEIYNDCPQVLSSSIVTVSVTADSYRQKTQGQIFLERVGHGNYWVIATKDGKYWLFPKSNITINIHQLKTVQFLFDCIGEYSANNGDFTLNQPASVAILPSGQEWKLEKKGRLVFGNDSPSSQ